MNINYRETRVLPSAGLTAQYRSRYDSINIWFASLDEAVERFERVCSEAERERACRFRFERDHDRYVVRHGMLRMLLGSYLGIAPATVEYMLGRNGKPALPDAAGLEKLHFNISYSHGYGAFALSGREVGLDVEYIRDIPEMDRIIERSCTAREKMEFNTLPVHYRKEAFFNCWTRKEAVIKATGQGLTRPLTSFSVSIRPDEPAVLIEIDGQSGIVAGWKLEALPCGAGYTAAIAYQGERVPAFCKTWPSGLVN